MYNAWTSTQLWLGQKIDAASGVIGHFGVGMTGTLGWFNASARISGNGQTQAGTGFDSGGGLKAGYTADVSYVSNPEARGQQFSVNVNFGHDGYTGAFSTDFAANASGIEQTGFTIHGGQAWGLGKSLVSISVPLGWNVATTPGGFTITTSAGGVFNCTVQGASASCSDQKKASH